MGAQVDRSILSETDCWAGQYNWCCYRRYPAPPGSPPPPPSPSSPPASPPPLHPPASPPPWTPLPARANELRIAGRHAAISLNTNVDGIEPVAFTAVGDGKLTCSGEIRAVDVVTSRGSSVNGLADDMASMKRYLLSGTLQESWITVHNATGAVGENANAACPWSNQTLLGCGAWIPEVTPGEGRLSGYYVQDNACIAEPGDAASPAVMAFAYCATLPSQLVFTTSVIEGSLSAAPDDSLSSASCPTGCHLTGCAGWSTTCISMDGIYTNDDRTCIAQQGVACSAGVIAQARCLCPTAGVLSMRTFRAANPATCPDGSALISCKSKSNHRQYFGAHPNPYGAKSCDGSEGSGTGVAEANCLEAAFALSWAA